MAKNENLHKAKDAKNDEFYTQLSDIENELRYYKRHFKDKIVYCNCDDPTWSEFWRYFHLNFNELGLKKLISTHFDKEEPTYKLEYYGEDDNDIEVGIKTPLKQNGDFESEESIELLKEADMVISNPPFSKFRSYIHQLMEYNKDFLIIGNKNAITYKEFFPLLKENKVWLGYTSPKEFLQPDGSIKKFGNIGWFTNLDIDKRHEELVLWQRYYDDNGNPLADAEERYPHYDNYPQAINVDKVADIPCDYYGVMGVPITVLDHFNPEQFEIVSFRKGEDGKDLVFTREREFNRTFVSLYDIDSWDDQKRRRENQWEAHLRKNNNKKEIEPIDFFFPNSMAIGGCMNNPKDTRINGRQKYARVLIRRR